MRKPEDLTRDELEGIVRMIQQALYLTHEPDDGMVFKPDKWSDGEISDVFAVVHWVFLGFGLAPAGKVPYEPPQ